MGSEFEPVNEMNRNIAEALLSSTSLTFLFFFGLHEHIIFYDSNITIQALLIFCLIALMPLLSVLSSFIKKSFGLYLTSLTVIIIVGLFASLIASPLLLPFSVISLVMVLRIFSRNYASTKSDLYKAAVFSTVFVVMFMLSGIVRFSPGVSGFSLSLASIYDDINPIGVPFFFSGGVILFTRYFVVTLSIASFILYTFLSSLLTENYALIFSYLKGKKNAMLGSTITGAITALSCQCESLAAAFPTVIVLLISQAIIPLIAESVLFVLLTNVLLLTFYFKGKHVAFVDRLWNLGNNKLYTLLMAFTIVFTPVFEMFGIYLSWQKNLSFFAGVNILMFVNGFFLSGLFAKVFPRINVGRLFTKLSLIVLSSLLMYIWYVPYFTFYAYTNSLIFESMSISAVVSGVLAEMTLRSLDVEGKKLYAEFLAMMFSMLAIIIFYLSVVTSTIIYPEFGLLQQVTFGLVLWGISLPVMWLSTNVTLNSYVSKLPI